MKNVEVLADVTFWSHDQEVKNCPTVNKNNNMVFHAWVKAMTQTEI